MRAGETTEARGAGTAIISQLGDSGLGVQCCWRSPASEVSGGSRLAGGDLPFLPFLAGLPGPFYYVSWAGPREGRVSVRLHGNCRCRLPLWRSVPRVPSNTNGP